MPQLSFHGPGDLRKKKNVFEAITVRSTVWVGWWVLNGPKTYTVSLFMYLCWGFFNNINWWIKRYFILVGYEGSECVGSVLEFEFVNAFWTMDWPIPTRPPRESNNRVRHSTWQSALNLLQSVHALHEFTSRVTGQESHILLEPSLVHVFHDLLADTILVL